MEYEVNWLGILQALLFIGCAVVVYFTRKQTAKAAELEGLKKDVILMQEQIKHLPDSKQINKIEVDTAAISEKLNSMDNTLRLLHVHILKLERERV